MSTSPRPNNARSRSRWPLVIGTALALLALVVGTVIVTQTMGDDETPPVVATSSPGSSSAGATGSNAAGADGCLGGVNPSRAVLKAHEQAKLDPKGAAEFAATVMRWKSQFPADEGYEKKAAEVITEDAGSDLLKPHTEEGAEGSSVWVTTTGGKYRVTEFSDDAATVELVVDGFVKSPESDDPGEVVSAARWRLAVVDGRWRAQDVDAIDREPEQRELESAGMDFKGTC